MAEFTSAGDTLRLEVAAAARAAHTPVERLRAHGSEGRGPSAGAVDVLIRLRTLGETGAQLGDLPRAAGMTPFRHRARRHARRRLAWTGEA